MSAAEALRLEDPNGSVILLNRIDDVVFTVSTSFVGDAPFRMFEADRVKIRKFLAVPLNG